MERILQHAGIALVTDVMSKAIDDKPTAAGTRWRNSGATKCSRQLALAQHIREQKLPLPTHDMDEAGYWVTNLGTMLHDEWQRAMKEQLATFGVDFIAEQKVHLPEYDLSGHLDGLTVQETDNERWATVYELKTMNGTAFRRVVGAPNGRQATTAEGPKLEHRVQLALNMVGASLLPECKGAQIEGHLIYMATEAVARGKGFHGIDRFTAGWVMSWDEAVQLAEAEFRRLTIISYALDRGLLPEANVLDEAYGKLRVKQLQSERAGAITFPCGYCPFQKVCSALPAGMAMISAAVNLHQNNVSDVEVLNG